MRKKVRKGCASIIANAVRQIALTSLDSLRPVAIRVGNHCDVISAGDSVLEDMVQITTNLNSLSFVSKSAGEIVEFRTVVKGTLKASDLKGNYFTYSMTRLKLLCISGTRVELVQKMIISTL